MELMRGLAFIALLFAGSAVGAELRQAEVCGDGTTHQAGYCPAVLSSASCSATGATTGSCSATSDETDGTRYVCATSSATALTCAEIIACSGGAAIAGASAAETGSNSIALSGLTTDAAHYGQNCNLSPEQWPSNRPISGSFTPTSGSVNQSRIDSVLAGRSPHFAFSYPDDPVITDTTTCASVTSAAQFNACADDAGTRITVTSSFTGNVRINASDIDVVMNNSLTITGNLTIGADFGQPNIARIRWTGGNVGTTYIHRCDDVLMDDFYASASASTAIESFPKNAIGTFATVNRVFSINSTYHLDGPNVPSGSWQWTMNTNGFPDRSDTIFFGNVKFSTNEFAQNNRFQFTNKLMIVDSVMNPDLQSSNGARFHEITDLWVRDSWRARGMQLDPTGSSSLPNITNALLDNFDGYDGYYADTEATSTGTVQNTTAYGGSLNIIPPYTDGGGNVSGASWDGVTLPDSSGVGAIRP